jgi:hypothetical protein
VDLVSIIKTVFRRWYVVAPIVLAGLAGAAYFQMNAVPQYQTTGSVLLAEPQLDPTGLLDPALALEETLERVQEPEVITELEQGGARLVIQPQDELLLDVVATAGDSRDAETSVLDALAWMERDLAEAAAAVTDDPRERVRARLSPTVTIEGLPNDSYRARGSFSVEDPTAEVPNPYPASITTGRVVEVAVESDAGRARIAEEAGRPVAFDISLEGPEAPIMTITTFGSDPASVIEGFSHVVTVVNAELEDRQERAEVPSSRWVVLETLAEPQNVQDISPPFERVAIAVLGLAGLLAVGVAILVESIALHRGPRRTARGKADTEARGTADDPFSTWLEEAERDLPPDLASRPVEEHPTSTRPDQS